MRKRDSFPREEGNRGSARRLQNRNFRKTSSVTTIFNSHASVATNCLTRLTGASCSTTISILCYLHVVRLSWHPTTTARAPSIPTPRAIDRTTLRVAILSIIQSVVASASTDCICINTPRAVLCPRAARLRTGAPSAPTPRRTVTITSSATTTTPRVNRREKTAHTEKSEKDRCNLHT